MKGKKVLVTGGAGFIGSNLCEALLLNGNAVVCYDNLSTGNKANIDNLKGDFTFIEGDVCNREAVLLAMDGVDVVLHQAALGSVPRSIHDPLSTNHVNITGFLTVLEAAKEKGVRRVVYASSSSVYGDIGESPKVESRIGKQLSPYAVSKYVNELYANVFSNLYGLELIGLRYFNVFGRRQTPDGPYAAAIPRFIRAFMDRESPVVFGDGEQTRDFTYIDNVIHASNLAATVTEPSALNQVYNVACGESTTINQVLDVLKKNLIPYDASIADVAVLYENQRIGDVRTSLASIRKSSELLGYKPVANFSDGIEQAIDWYVNNLR